jgi:LacI family transcriptional regulator
MAKYNQLSNLVKRRILDGDYAIKGLPAERQLALENGVAHMTARRALLQLQEEGFLVRASNGRLEINRGRGTESNARPLQVVFLAPSFNSPAIDRWWDVLESAMLPFGGRMRRLYYRHWEDPLIIDGLKGFDGGFILPCAETIQPEIAEKLRNVTSPVVMLSDDLSASGIPSLRLIPPVFVQKLLDHLEAQGHTRIACLNAQPRDEVIDDRIAQWQVWMAAHHFSGPLLDEPVQTFQDPTPRAYTLMNRVLSEGKFDASALFCTTHAAAVGAMRALHEHGLRPGYDVAIGLVDGEGQAAYQIPSLTALEAPNILPHLTICLEWIARGGKDWKGPLLLQPTDIPLVIRESTSTPRYTHQISTTNLAMAANQEMP